MVRTASGPETATLPRAGQFESLSCFVEPVVGAGVWEVSVWEVSDGEVSVGEVSVGEVSVGEVSVGEVSVGEVSVGEVSVRGVAAAVELELLVVSLVAGVVEVVEGVV
jgi:hypothetical protein